MYSFLPFFSVLVLIVSLIQSNATANSFIGSVGANIDYASRAGREEKIAMEMAVDNFYKSNGSKIMLKLVDSQGSATRAISSAIDLIDNHRVQALVGALTWQEAKFVTETNNSTREVPIISLATASLSPPSRLPYFVPLVDEISLQMRCTAAIIGSYRWRKIIAIYEDSNAYASDSGIITLLSDALRDVGSVIKYHSSFPPLASLPDPRTVIREELEKLRNQQYRVFVIVQSSLPLATILFKEAKRMGMMENDYVWITTDGLTSLLDSVNSSVLSSMQGILGFKAYFSETTTSFREFRVTFRGKYLAQYPEEESADPSIFALRAYDAITAIAQSMEKIGTNNTSKVLVERFLSSDFRGLSGSLSNTPIFCIVNVVGKSYIELGFWSRKFGFSENIIENGRSDGESMDVLKSVYWPGGSRLVPRGWTATVNHDVAEKPLRIGVPSRSAFTQFVRVIYDQNNETYVTGFSVDVFAAVVKRLPFNLPYELVPFNGSYDDLVEQVYHKTFDAAVGDTEIMADRCRYAEFSQPYVESGLVMVVTVHPEKSQEAWMFLKPFTKEMWIQTAALGLFTGFIVWLNESGTNPDFGGTIGYQIGTLLWFSFTTFFFAHREPIKSNLSRLVVATWLFAVLIVTASYTASLTSMLTVSRLEPSVIDIDLLKRTNALVGCNGNSFIVNYLVKVLGFNEHNIVKISSIDEYPEALSRGNIMAAFFVTLHAKVFLAKYCYGFTMAGPTFKLGGFGFVFPKGSPLAFDISEAILKVTESGDMQRLEQNMLSSSNCSTLSSNLIIGNPSLSHKPFSGLFLISGSVSTISLFIILARLFRKRWKFESYIQGTILDKRIWVWALTFLGKYYIPRKDNEENSTVQVINASNVEEQLSVL